MTREEALKELKEYEDGLDLEYATPFDKAVLCAIKALEQKPIIDKIRAEIEKEADTSNRLHGISEIGLRKALKIIDKYKAESEDT